ncbi:TetR/AcrR family transcriptional regulator [Mycobacteroides chelonae]|uniref:TetR family transcriptional regulator n=1 Tax=Mycobacteroides chelonae TaxID=1774 RepID=A0A1S1M6J6_MYCCH|nr:TetR/AcrR family transcriptional regulator [Mycobacteroides chelonae]OHU80714.1 TetR family transcriptional regulator [Mycobacteroides chelonae]
MIDNRDAPSTTRSTAVQRRGIERVQAILDAAEELHSEQGYSAATLKAIGERAGIPTASLYHYFADRHRVDAALLERHLTALNESVRSAIQDRPPRTLREAVEASVNPLLAYFRAHPSLVQLWFVGRDATRGLSPSPDAAWAEQLWRLLLDAELIRAETPVLVLQLAFEAGDRLFDVAFQRSPTGDEATIDELRRMVTAYLQTYAPQALDR